MDATAPTSTIAPMLIGSNSSAIDGIGSRGAPDDGERPRQKISATRIASTARTLSRM